MTNTLRYLVFVVLLMCPLTVSWAAELEYLQVSNQKKRFFVHSKAILDAPIQPVYDTLVDFDNYERFSSIYHDARWLSHDDQGGGDIYTYTRGCIAFFCKGFVRVEAVTVTPLSDIKTLVDPARSDVKHGVSTWKLSSIEQRTVVEFELEFEPDFWVPPLIGPYMVKRMLRKGGADAIERIEVLAQDRHTRRSGILPR